MEVKPSIITEFDEETGEWEIVEGQDELLDEMFERRFYGGITEAEAIRQAIDMHVKGES